MIGKAHRMKALWFVLSHPIAWLRLCRWIGSRNAWWLIVTFYGCGLTPSRAVISPPVQGLHWERRRGKGGSIS
jgi:hypothetical protein